MALMIREMKSCINAPKYQEGRAGLAHVVKTNSKVMVAAHLW